MTVPIGPAGVDECERNECMGCMWCELPEFCPCSDDCLGWCISCDDATGIPAIEACDACWYGVNRAPHDDYYRRQVVCNVALAQALSEWLKRAAPEVTNG
jgi:hypothetical protein